MSTECEKLSTTDSNSLQEIEEKRKYVKLTEEIKQQFL